MRPAGVAATGEAGADPNPILNSHRAADARAYPDISAHTNPNAVAYPYSIPDAHPYSYSSAHPHIVAYPDT